MPTLDILLPTCNRRESLIMTLAGVASQTLTDLRLIVADQSDERAQRSAVVRALRATIELRGGIVEWHERPQVHGVAEQREFLLSQARTAAVLFLDDDVLMGPSVAERLLAMLREQGCGFVGAFPIQSPYRFDVRPEQQVVEWWDGPVRPECITPGAPEWRRAELHRAANLWHVSQRLPPGTYRLYKVAWVASCVLYDRAKLLDVGGFAFWPRLPRWHSGEDVLVQNLLMRRWGGCGVIPADTYFSQVPSTVLNAAGTVDGHALDLLPEMVARFAPDTATEERGAASVR